MTSCGSDHLESICYYGHYAPLLFFSPIYKTMFSLFSPFYFILAVVNDINSAKNKESWILNLESIHTFTLIKISYSNLSTMGTSPERQQLAKRVPTSKITSRQQPVQTSDWRMVFMYRKRLIFIVKGHQTWSIPGFFGVFLLSYILVVLRLVRSPLPGIVYLLK